MAAFRRLAGAVRRMQAQVKPIEYEIASGELGRLLTPSLAVFTDKVQHNIDTMLHAMGGDAASWRPHIKTIKTPELMTQLLQSGVHKFKCATPREALVLAETASRTSDTLPVDVLVAFAHAGANLRAVQQVAEAFPDISFSILAEDAAAVDDIPSCLNIFADVNPEYDRTGMPLQAAEGGDLLRLARAAGSRFRGVHFYCGHSSKWSDVAERGTELHKLYARLLALEGQLLREGVPVEELCTSGTPSVAHALTDEALAAAESKATVSPGTVVLADAMTMELCPSLPLVPAAVVVTRVISHPGRGLFTCDVGSKGVAAELPEYGVGMFVGHTPEWQPLRPSEEHLPCRMVEGSEDAVPARGDIGLLVPTHVCPTVNLAESMALMARHGDTGAYHIRDVVPVSARAHGVLFQ